MDGAVEISVHLGVADAVADVVESGRTLRQAGLKTVGEPVLESEAIVVAADAGRAERGSRGNGGGACRAHLRARDAQRRADRAHVRVASEEIQVEIQA